MRRIAVGVMRQDIAQHGVGLARSIRNVEIMRHSQQVRIDLATVLIVGAFSDKGVRVTDVLEKERPDFGELSLVDDRGGPSARDLGVERAAAFEKGNLLLLEGLLVLCHEKIL